MEIIGRTCVSPATALSGAGLLLSVHWPALLGTARLPLTAFSIESRVTQGFAGSGWLPALVVSLAIAGIAVAPRSAAVQGRPPRFAHYLILAGLCSVAGYLFGRCGQVSLFLIRYELLSLLGIVGLAGWFLAVQAPRAIRAAWMAALALWVVVIAVPHVRLIADTRPIRRRRPRWN
jgi:hypothetical protein